MTERRNLIKLREQLQDFRAKARHTEVELVAELRRSVINARQNNPAALYELYQEHEEAQDKIGVLEENYASREMEYDLTECKFHREESDFYSSLIEDLCDIGIVPLTPISYRPAPSRPATPPDSWFTSASFALFDQECITNELETSDVEQDNVSSEDADSYMGRLRRVIKDAETLEHRKMPVERRASDPATSTELQRHDQSKRQPRPSSETELAQLRPKFPTRRGQISQWILESLKESSLQKALAKSQLSSQDIDDREWWKLLKKSWGENDEPAQSEMSDVCYLNENETKEQEGNVRTK